MTFPDTRVLLHLWNNFEMSNRALAEMFGVSTRIINRHLDQYTGRGYCVDCGAVVNDRSTRCRECQAKRRGKEMKGEGNPSWGKRGKNSPLWKEPVECTCKFCESIFKVKPGSKREYCSHECSSADKWIAPIAECDNCGKEIRAKKTWVGHQRFCSLECYHEWNRGENHPNFVDGLGTHGYPSEFNDELKMAIRERDNYTCAICRLSGKQVHHIDYDKMNNNSSNLITLCASCHGATGYNRPYWQENLSTLLKNRTNVQRL